MKIITTKSVGVLIIGMGLFQPSIAKQFNKNVLDSQEYKLMLKIEQFDSIDKGIQGFQKAIAEKQPVSKVVFHDKYKLKNRIVTYLDTKQCHLKNNGFILRKRFTIKDGAPDRMKVTLKFRGDDIDKVGGKSVVAQPLLLPKSKFEVDVVKDPLLSIPVNKYSRSVSIELGKYKKMSDLIKLYPVLEEVAPSDQSKTEKSKMKLKRVNKFIAFETMVEIGSIEIAAADCDASFSFWYNTQEKSKPIVAEFSYVCEKETDEANQLFQTILGLSEWNSPNSSTKTNLAYGKTCPLQ